MRECLYKGPLAGYPVTGVKAILYDGSYHEVDSSEAAFKAAAAIAFREGLKNAKPVLLEPYCKLKISVKNDFLGDVMGDINKCRGRIMGTASEGDKTVVLAEAPQAELLNYTTRLRSLTRGCGRFVSEFLDYEEVPRELAEKIAAARAAEKQE